MKLIYPEEKYLKFYQEARLEHELNGVTTYDFLDSSKVDIFEMVFNFRHNIDLPPNYVPSTYLWMVEGSEFIGEINIRHALTDSLKKFGGHIGYGVRYSMWNKGYGTLMLAKALKYAKEESRA